MHEKLKLDVIQLKNDQAIQDCHMKINQDNTFKHNMCYGVSQFSYKSMKITWSFLIFKGMIAPLTNMFQFFIS